MTGDERFEEAMRHNQMVKNTHRRRGGKCSRCGMEEMEFFPSRKPWNDIYEPCPKREGADHTTTVKE
jgi:hypothetical protein